MINSLKELKSCKCPHDEVSKKTYHKRARRFLKDLAKTLNAYPSDYDLRVCPGGIAVPGEVTLHTDDLYVQTFFSYTSERLISLLVRKVSGRKDYCGFRNHEFKLEGKDEDYILETCKTARADYVYICPPH